MVNPEDKCDEKPQMFGRTEGDYIMIVPPIKLKTIPNPLFFNFINNHCGDLVQFFF